MVQKYYAPNNATLVVVGDVNPEQVRVLAENYFGALPRKAIPERKVQKEPPMLGKKRSCSSISEITFADAWIFCSKYKYSA